MPSLQAAVGKATVHDEVPLQLLVLQVSLLQVMAVPVQEPPLQWSVCVQATPSSQAAAIPIHTVR